MNENTGNESEVHYSCFSLNCGKFHQYHVAQKECLDFMTLRWHFDRTVHTENNRLDFLLQMIKSVASFIK